MAKQLQLRRGPEQAQNLFVGAEGEVTMTTDTKELRVHDGTKVGGFRMPTLVDVQYPSVANNYTWYRKYADGWVEQGGIITAPSDAAYTQNLPVAMSDSNYVVLLTRNTGTSDYGSGTINARWQEVWDVAASSFKTWGTYGGQNTVYWEVKGMAA